ncbi:hypothetical protein AK812_SmicGene10689 [Symbiodinium microadriaticum]|uniref:Uncharacterized protein n=1 Tax=Symbiodinium microadriaticum TaxID=2951 RepID=A0A1Q9EF65_SYMMI|nr:hypothetical protein AK812_SmicGene10689 [Symbiodinium microadriaticum]
MTSSGILKATMEPMAGEPPFGALVSLGDSSDMMSQAVIRGDARKMPFDTSEDQTVCSVDGSPRTSILERCSWTRFFDGGTDGEAPEGSAEDASRAARGGRALHGEAPGGAAQGPAAASFASPGVALRGGTACSSGQSRGVQPDRVGEQQLQTVPRERGPLRSRRR